MLKRGWAILFRYLMTQRKEVILLSVLGVFSGFANGLLPYGVGKFFDALIAVDKVTVILSIEFSLMTLLGIWLTLQIISNSVDWVIDMKRRRMGTYLRLGHVAEAGATILQLPVTLFKQQKIGEIIERVQLSSQAISTIIEQVVIDLAPQLLRVVIGVTVVFLLSPLLAGILIVGVLLYIFTLIKIVPPLVKMQRAGVRARREAFGSMGDMITNFQTVKQSSAEEYERKNLWYKCIDKAAYLWNKVERIWTGILFYQRIIVVFTQFIVFFISISLIAQEALTIGELIAVNVYAGFIFGPFAILGRNWQTIQNGLVALEQTDNLLRLPKEKYEASVPVDKKNFRWDVTFQDVYFEYSEKDPRVLHGLDFEVKQGEVVAFVGESGVGKSTTIELLSGYYFPVKGDVRIGGYSTKEVGLKFLRENIAVVPQEPVLFNDTVEVNIKYGRLEATKEEIVEAAKKAHAHEFIENFPEKYEQRVGERGIKLSVGQKQRIAIARAILRKPRILILDEPTSALDAKTERIITEALEKLMKGSTTFIIAHRLSTVRKADRIFVFEKGKIVEEGKHDELIKIENGVYRHLYEYQVGLH